MQSTDVVEQAFGIRKCHIVLGKIARRLLVVPFELKHASLLEFSSICQVGARVKS
ncbi:hypothetical protein [Mesorhizobium sp. B2-8-9]|uniref:hypothetical protein n=1 Tax=Mesorhizobium sp. B2-8-9 TaxID=2589899 RepID=UPI001FF01977|nr:hypothetical protein [Mesorhizobium sp. B2-8-9]